MARVAGTEEAKDRVVRGGGRAMQDSVDQYWNFSS